MNNDADVIRFSTELKNILCKSLPDEIGDEIIYNYHVQKFNTRNLCRIFTSTGNLKFLIWMRENRYYCNWNEMCEYAIEHGHLEILKWLKVNKFVFHERLLFGVARSSKPKEIKQFLTDALKDYETETPRIRFNHPARDLLFLNF